jgi:hypothetical protein
VACGADGADGVGAVTVGRDVPVELRVVVLADRCSEPDDDRCSEPDECFPERVDVSSAADRVAIPIPIDAPRAPAIPRPASPAWSLLLRWRGVMPRRCVRFLWRTCEHREPAVSVT